MMFGMLAAFVFMAIYYKVFGLIADVVLVGNVVLLTAFLSMVGAALTLPGIAAVVLTVGMAVDANILIYERIREELRNGVSPRAAITRRLRSGVLRHLRLQRHGGDCGLGAVAVRRRRGARLRGGAGARHRHLDVHLADGQPRIGADHLRRQAQGRTLVHIRFASRSKSMEFFHKVTRFPFMNTRKVWYGLSAVLIVGLVRAGGGARTESWASISPAAWWSRPISRRRRTSNSCAPRLAEGGRARRAGAGLRQFARYPGAPAAGSEREGRADRGADSRSVQDGRRRREAAAHGSGRAAGRPGTVRQGRAGPWWRRWCSS